MAGLAAAATIAAAVVGTGVAVKGNIEQKKNAKKSSQLAAQSQEKQDALLKRQEAVTRRSQLEADKREEDLSGQLSARRRAVAARSRGRGGLAFTAENSGLKTQLGG